jgi:hypothetical protein
MKVRWYILLLVIGLVQAASGRFPAIADDSSAREYELKAAFIYKFAQFIEWPAAAFSSESDPIVVATIGDDPFQGSLDRVMAGKSVGARPMAVAHFGGVDQIQRCHVLFVSAANAGDLPAILRKVGKSPVITIGEQDDFCQGGGIIQFLVEDGKIHFEINTDAADAAGVKISSRLLKLAKIYKP